MSNSEMRMLRWISGVTREERIKNEYVRDSVGVASIVDKMRENILRWFWACDETRDEKKQIQ
jgi:hypothetical protein